MYSSFKRALPHWWRPPAPCLCLHPTRAHHSICPTRPHLGLLRVTSSVYHPFIRGYERRSRIPDHSIMPVLKTREEIRAGNVQGRPARLRVQSEGGCLDEDCWLVVKSQLGLITPQINQRNCRHWWKCHVSCWVLHNTVLCHIWWDVCCSSHIWAHLGM